MPQSPDSVLSLVFQAPLIPKPAPMTQTVQQNAPNLRFPEFEDAWKTRTLGDYFTFKNGVNADKAAYGRGRKFINVLDIISDTPITSDTIIGSVDISDNEFTKNEVRYGDILFQRSSETREEVGQSNVYLDQETTATFGGFVIRGRPIAEINPEYFHNLLKTSRVRKDMTSRSGGSTRYNVGQESLSAVSVTIASTLTEQKKIADFLSAVDKKIAQLSRKRILLENYKKGCMQKLLSQKISFKSDDGSHYPDWEEKRLGEVFTERSERGTPDAELLSVTLNRGVVKASEVDRATSASADRSNYKTVKIGDIAYNSMRMWQGASGHSQFEGIVSPAYTVAVPIHGQVSAFWSYYFKLTKVIHIFERYSQGLTSDTWNLKFPALSKIKLPVPDPDEQRKIAEFLSAIDRKIDLVGQELSHARAFKQGLLQQMFV